MVETSKEPQIKVKRKTKPKSTKVPAKKKTVTGKSSVKKTVKKSVAKPARKTRSKKTEAGTGGKNISSAERAKMIEVAAYLRSEKRSFLPGYEINDWIEAEKEVDKVLKRMLKAKS